MAQERDGMENSDDKNVLFLNSLRQYSNDCPMLDVVETKFGLIAIWVDSGGLSGIKHFIYGEVIESMENVEKFLFGELKSAAIDLYCKEEPDRADDPEFNLSNSDIHGRFVSMIERYLPWIEDVESYIAEKEQEYEFC